MNPLFHNENFLLSYPDVRYYRRDIFVDISYLITGNHQPQISTDVWRQNYFHLTGIGSHETSPSILLFAVTWSLEALPPVSCYSQNHETWNPEPQQKSPKTSISV